RRARLGPGGAGQLLRGVVGAAAAGGAGGPEGCGGERTEGAGGRRFLVPAALRRHRRVAAAAFRTTGPARRSGTDYTPEQLSGATRSEPGPTSGSSATASAALAPGDERLSEGAGLDRLTGREALDACLGAISSEHAGGAVTVDLIDYASFQGRPALVVTFVDAGGGRWAWVSGPECGVPGSGADTRFSTRVG
ncbi:hypothetical protein DKL51_09750, partial [Micromonospora globispora]